jgi:hypothetical protein
MIFNLIGDANQPFSINDSCLLQLLKLLAIPFTLPVRYFAPIKNNSHKSCSPHRIYIIIVAIAIDPVDTSLATGRAAPQKLQKCHTPTLTLCRFSWFEDLPIEHVSGRLRWTWYVKYVKCHVSATPVRAWRVWAPSGAFVDVLHSYQMEARRRLTTYTCSSGQLNRNSYWEIYCIFHLIDTVLRNRYDETETPFVV